MKRVRDLLPENCDTNHKLDVLIEKTAHLTAREADVHAEVENAELLQGKRRREEVAHWLNDVEAMKGEVQSIKNKHQQQTTLYNSQLFSDIIEKTIKDVEELNQQGRFPNGLVLDDQKSRELPFPLAGIRAVTVIDLSYTPIQTLPDSICGLENLTALILFCCKELMYVPSLSNLTKLTLLDLAFCIKLREAPRGMENLRCLKKLNCLWNLNDLTYFHMLRDSQHFNELDGYEFWIHGSSNTDPYCVEPDCVKTDSTWNYDKRVILLGEEIGPALSNILLPITTQFLSIMSCDMNGNGSTLGDIFPSLNRVTELKSLQITDCRGLEYVWSNSSEFPFGFGALECTQFWKCHDLKSLIKLPSPSPCTQLADAFSQLKMLRVQKCDELKAVFPFKLLQQQPCFPNIELISVMMCQKIEEIFEANSRDDASLILKLPKLRSMCITYLPKLCSIYKGLICTPLCSVIGLEDTPNYGTMHRGPCLLWDDCVSGLDFDNKLHIWQVLVRDYPEDAMVLSSWMNRRRFYAGEPVLSSWIEWINSVEEDC